MIRRNLKVGFYWTEGMEGYICETSIRSLLRI